MDNELEVIRDQMEQKRAALADKLDALEDQVLDTVHEVTNTVSSTVRGVTETVDSVTEDIKESVQAVKHSLNVSEKVREHPWIALGGAFATGFVGAMLLGPSSRRRSSSQPMSSGYETNRETNGKAAAARPTSTQASYQAPQEAEPSSGLTSLLGTAASEALETVKSMAVGTLMGVLSEVVNDALPASLKEEANKLFGDLNARLGGKELHKLNLFSGQSNHPTDSWKGEENDYGDQTEMAGSVGSAPWQDQELVGQSDRRRSDGSSGRLRANDRAARGANGKEA